ncbi:MAG: hypothetical protein WBB82_07155 [Limnothrix sp.]
MDINQQLQILIEQAPQDGTTPEIIAQAVNPALKTFATKLKQTDYFVCKSIQGDWLLTTLGNRQDPTLEKKVIYAFCTLDRAKTFQKQQADPQLTAQAMPVTHILFQLFSIKNLDSLIFMENVHKLNQGTEIHRIDLQNAIQAELRQYQQNKANIGRFA